MRCFDVRGSSCQCLPFAVLALAVKKKRRKEEKKKEIKEHEYTEHIKRFSLGTNTYIGSANLLKGNSISCPSNNSPAIARHNHLSTLSGANRGIHSQDVQFVYFSRYTRSIHHRHKAQNPKPHPKSQPHPQHCRAHGVPGDPTSVLTSKVTALGLALPMAPGNVESLKSIVAFPKS